MTAVQAPLTGLVDTALTNPTQLVEHLRSDGRPWYLVQMTVPFAWLFARLPDVALISAVVLASRSMICPTSWACWGAGWVVSVANKLPSEPNVRRKPCGTVIGPPSWLRTM